MIFVTVGSMFPFDRLIRTADELVRAGLVERKDICAQIGSGQYEPSAMPFERFLSKEEFERRLQQADVVLSHAGIGTIATALQFGKPLLVLPRLKRYGEHVNDHQIPTARKYEQLGHVLVAYEPEQIGPKLAALGGFQPAPRTVNARGVAERIGRYLGSLT